MGAILFGAMKTRVKLQADNMQASDPHATYVGDYINESANAVILMALARDRRNLNMFPELRNIRWSDITTAGAGYMDKPSNMLVLDSVSITRSSAAYLPGSQTEYPVHEEPNQQQFGMLNKAATGYPTIFHDSASTILLWPTPTASTLTRVIVRGMKMEAALDDDLEYFSIHERWHPVIVDHATYLTFQRQGDAEKAAKWLTLTEKRLTETINLVGLANRHNRVRISIAGAP